MATAEIGAMIRALEAAPTPAALILAERDLLPARPGFYTWWGRPGAIPAVPFVAHPADPDLGLLYVGISPGRRGSQGTIRSRVRGNHLRGNISSSTYRLVLAAFLRDKLGLRPELRRGRYRLAADGEATLRAWQAANLALTWCERPDPWAVEHEVIARMRPPLNSSGNAAHPFAPAVRAARDELRRLAREDAVP
jgi:hypothetical protein